MNIRIISAHLHNDITSINAVLSGGLKLAASTLRDTTRCILKDETGLSISVQGPRGETIKKAAGLLCLQRPHLRLPAVVASLEGVVP